MTAFGTMPYCFARILYSGVNLKPLFALFWQLCLFRRGPQDVPYAPALLVIILLAEMALGVASVLMLEKSYQSEQAAGVLLGLTVWLALVWGILGFKGQKTRFVQTMTACLGTDLVMTLLVLPLQVFLVTYPESGSAPYLLRLVVLIWDILIKGRIYSAAMNLGRVQANLLSITIWLVVVLMSVSLLPAEALQPAAPAEQPTLQP